MEVAELFKLQMNPSEICSFMDKGEGVNCFFSSLEGYKGMDVLLLSDTEVFVLVRWNDDRQFDKNLPLILNAVPINEWFKDAVILSHRPAILKIISIG
jgi:hypothetical protein